MKFHLIKIGQEFIYQEQAYTKISPLLGSSNVDGGQKMFRRADPVSVSGSTQIEQSPSTDEMSIALSVLNDLLDSFVNECALGLESLSNDFDDSQLKNIANTLNQAKRHLQDKIKSNGK